VGDILRNYGEIYFFPITKLDVSPAKFLIPKLPGMFVLNNPNISCHENPKSSGTGPPPSQTGWRELAQRRPHE
jgi:hypothetical protein